MPPWEAQARQRQALTGRREAAKRGATTALPSAVVGRRYRPRGDSRRRAKQTFSVLDQRPRSSERMPAVKRSVASGGWAATREEPRMRGRDRRTSLPFVSRQVAILDGVRQLKQKLRIPR